ncbi:MAG: ribulose-phosphate 3-epimerase [Anaerolinea sp.]|nr:ribulose-phosphate 3-epimerase [Anaerolinea sp.]
MKYILSASILSADFAHLQNDIFACEKAGVDWIHIDVMDGHFVPNLTMGPFIVETCRKITKLPLDCHLMIEKPENLLDAFINAGASNITIHPENNPLTLDTLAKIKAAGCRAGIAINPSTPVEVIEPIIAFADLILVMTVNPGYSGQKFMPEVIEKIARISTLAQKCETPPIIEVDGGINTDNIALVRDAGAIAFVSASAIFHHPAGITAGIEELRVSLV